MEPARLDGSTRHRTPFYALLTANIVSRLGSELTFIAIPWFVLQTTGSAAKTGITLATGTVPIILAGIFGGVIVDRLGYKRSSVVADLASGLAVATIPLLYDTIGLAFWQLLVLVFLAALLRIPGATARDSLLPDLAERARMPLERANSLSQAVPRAALLIGPAVAGVLIAVLGTSNVLWLDAASFALSAIIVAVALPGSAAAVRPAARSYLAETLDGFQFIRRDRLLLWVVLTFTVGSLISEPIYVVVMPVYAKRIYGSAFDLGLMYSALAAGSLIGLVYYAVLGPRLSRRLTLIAGFVVRALTFWVLVALPSLPIVLGAIAINAIAFEPINPLTTSLLQSRVPEGLRGRVFGTFDALAAGTLPVGTLIGGFLLAGIGLVPTLAMIAGASLLQAVMLPIIPALRRIDVSEIAPASTEQPVQTIP